MAAQRTDMPETPAPGSGTTDSPEGVRQASKAPGAASEYAAETAKGRSRKGEGTAAFRRGEVARRKLVWWSVTGFFAACLAGTARFFFPRALFEPKTRLTIGYPSDFGIGVSTRFQQSNRIWVVRDSSRLYVIYARCSHLGCTPDWKEAEAKFKCPCHGSGFDLEGMNFEGPAPKPLARVHVELDVEGRIVVDSAKLYDTDQWDQPGAFLPV